MSNVILCGIGGGGKPKQIKEISFTENGAMAEILPDEGAVISNVYVTVDVPETAIDGVSYVLTDDKTEYTVSEYDENIGSDVVIHSDINSIPTTTINARAFKGCSALQSMEIPNSVTSIGDNAFDGCSGLTELVIPESVTTVGTTILNNCSPQKLTLPFIPAVLRSIFGGSTNNSIGDYLHTVVFTKGSTISQYTFDGCYKLTSVTIPASVTSIGDSAFHDCSNLTNLYIEDLAAWCNFDFSLTDTHPFYNNKGSLYLNNELITALVIPESATSIGGHLFFNCKDIVSVTMHDNVTSIGYNAFGGCSSLASVTIPASVTNIGKLAFQNCTGLTNIVISDGVISIDEGAFRNCESVTSIAIPNSVTSIGWGAFNGCSGLTSITIGNGVTNVDNYAFYNCANCLTFDFSTLTSIPTLGGTYAFYGTSDNKQIIVPDNLYDSWIVAENWSTYADNIVKASEAA